MSYHYNRRQLQEQNSQRRQATQAPKPLTLADSLEGYENAGERQTHRPSSTIRNTTAEPQRHQDTRDPYLIEKHTEDDFTAPVTRLSIPDEDQRRRMSVPASRPTELDDEEGDYFTPTRTPTSARRYPTKDGKEIFRQGDKQLEIHRGLPSQKRRISWAWGTVIGMALMLLMFLAGNWVLSAWNGYQMNQTYGMPRTYQVDQVVGHHDSPDHPSHFIFENLNGRCFFIEFPGGQVSLGRIFYGPTLITADPGQWPVTATFRDVNGDGKIDVVMLVDNESIVYLNTGDTFKAS